MPDRMPEGMPDRMPDKMSDRMPQDMPDRIPEDLPEDMPDRMPEDMPDRMPEDMPDKMPWDMPDRMPEDLPVTKCINVMVGITRSKVFWIPWYVNIHIYVYWRKNSLVRSHLLEIQGWSSAEGTPRGQPQLAFPKQLKGCWRYSHNSTGIHPAPPLTVLLEKVSHQIKMHNCTHDPVARPLKSFSRKQLKRSVMTGLLSPRTWPTWSY